jgi:hypothetical protein
MIRETSRVAAVLDVIKGGWRIVGCLNDDGFRFWVLEHPNYAKPRFLLVPRGWVLPEEVTR